MTNPGREPARIRIQERERTHGTVCARLFSLRLRVGPPGETIRSLLCFPVGFTPIYTDWQRFQRFQAVCFGRFLRTFGHFRGREGSRDRLVYYVILLVIKEDICCNILKEICLVFVTIQVSFLMHKYSIFYFTFPGEKFYKLFCLEKCFESYARENYQTYVYV